MTKKSNFIIMLITFFAVLSILTSCGTANEDTNEDVTSGDVEQNQQIEEEEGQTGTNDYSEIEKNPIITITMQNNDTMKVELYPQIAPNTVENFISLVEQGFYDGLVFHRVLPGFMIQGGDPQGTGMGGPGYSIPGEFSSNGFNNTLSHERGVISMARTQDPNSAGSQFFIMVEEAPHLDGEYAAFGKVLEGIEVADQIVQVERDEVDKPLNEQKINKVSVETFGVDYDEPNKVGQ
ncbi:peptidylprolyl isomerase [Litchfieldia alkalitelluris]|uniref:peptidylprolyl isomerase n=1 Tax=Litchfieldia alkalitelluris TaxID=304268 RepID=UPI000998C09C|nr:peptidylprolyl isomerase [Litchfieldia alkalitelluris]